MIVIVDIVLVNLCWFGSLRSVKLIVNKICESSETILYSNFYRMSQGFRKYFGKRSAIIICMSLLSTFIVIKCFGLIWLHVQIQILTLDTESELWLAWIHIFVDFLCLTYSSSNPFSSSSTQGERRREREREIDR